MTSLCCNVVSALAGKTLCTAESCTGGGIGCAITSVPGSSAVYKGGIVSYSNEIKMNLLKVSEDDLRKHGPVSAVVAKAMAVGARDALSADIAVSVTGLAGPGGDEYGNAVGTVFVGYADAACTLTKEFHFSGDREYVRKQAISQALQLILEMNP